MKRFGVALWLSF